MRAHSQMNGKICLITGATSGIGLAAAAELARRGATVILGARNEIKAEKARNAIAQVSGSERLHTALADLSLQEEVRRMAAGIRERFEHIDVLVNNAGAVHFLRQSTQEGIEKTWATNHLSYFLLSELLMPALYKSTAGRIINVSSSAHRRGVIHFDDIHLRKGYSWRKAYSQSKLANLLFTFELAKRLEGSSVTANALHPGWVATEIGQNSWLARAAAPFIFRNAKTPDQGAETVVYLASAPEVEGISGEFFINCEIAQAAERAHDELAAKRLWALSEEMTRE